MSRRDRSPKSDPGGLQTFGEGGYQRFVSVFQPKKEGPAPKGKKGKSGKPKKDNGRHGR